MKVLIIENESGRATGSYTINLSGLNYTPSEKDYFSEAWKCAVEDGIVEADSRGKYSFRLNQ